MSVQIKLNYDKNELIVTDNGLGLPDKALDKKDEPDGMGLKIMKHRAGKIDGEVTVHRASPTGTVVKCLFKE